MFCRQGDVQYTNRWRCDKCHCTTTITPEHHQLLAHVLKTEYYVCAGCEYADVIGMRFLAHLQGHTFRFQQIDHHWETNQPPIRRFLMCRFTPTCDFQTSTSTSLAEHLTLVHAQRPSGIHPDRWLKPLSPVCRFPPSLATLAKQHDANMLGKLYGESTDVVVFTDIVPYGVLAVRSLKGNRLGFVKIRRHPAHPCYDKSTDLALDDVELPRSKAELFDVKASPWTVLLTLSMEARLEPDTVYHLVEPYPHRQQFTMKVVTHRV